MGLLQPPPACVPTHAYAIGSATCHALTHPVRLIYRFARSIDGLNVRVGVRARECWTLKLSPRPERKKVLPRTARQGTIGRYGLQRNDLKSPLPSLRVAAASSSNKMPRCPPHIAASAVVLRLLLWDVLPYRKTAGAGSWLGATDSKSGKSSLCPHQQLDCGSATRVPRLRVPALPGGLLSTPPRPRTHASTNSTPKFR